MTIVITWTVVGKLAVSLLIGWCFGLLGALCCMDDDSWPNQVWRAILWVIGAGLIIAIWTVL